MELLFIIIGLVPVVVIVWFYQTYVTLIKIRNKTKEAFSGINIQLKKRYDLIPNILTLANKFMQHEKGLFEEITKLRTQALSLPNDPNLAGQKLELDSKIKNLMGQVMVSVENYPELKSDTSMITAMQTYNEVEEHIAAARRFYNSAVNELNNKVEIFPSSLVASMIGVKGQEFFTATEEETKSVNASDYLK
ncbi:LemA family protein [bacterium]|nr:LemA family protein [bacterium]